MYFKSSISIFCIDWRFKYKDNCVQIAVQDKVVDESYHSNTKFTNAGLHKNEIS